MVCAAAGGGHGESARSGDDRRVSSAQWLPADADHSRRCGSDAAAETFEEVQQGTLDQVGRGGH
eukprot:scaffold340_cov256-Pinguiococcus_pyrenoidosus.AAC.11